MEHGTPLLDAAHHDDVHGLQGTVMAYVVMAYLVMASIVMAYIVMAYIVMAYIVMAYIVMARSPCPWRRLWPT